LVDDDLLHEGYCLFTLQAVAAAGTGSVR